MKFKPKFSGRWYGLELKRGEVVDLAGSLADKAAAQPQNFAKVKARGKNDK